jgi:hypothetical protein
MEYYESNKDEINEKKKVYTKNNKEKIKEKSKEYYKANKEIINKKKLEYSAKRKLTDATYKLSCGIRSLIYSSIKTSGFKKLTKTEQILGCTFDELKKHLENKFESWMTWENRGNPKDGILELDKSWDIDHIIPISSATCEADIIKLNHYTNLQPLCSYINRKIKRNKKTI